MKKALWTVQGVLAVVFLFNAYMKFTMPVEMLGAGPFSAEFMYFIAACELLGGLGLVLPGIFRIHTSLTPLAAAGLVIIMIGATVSTVALMGPAMAILPLVAGLLSAFVAYGRWRVAPLSDRNASELQLAG